jgi:hypothetical protein
MKRFAAVLALVVGTAGTAVGTASADSNTATQLASIKQAAVAFAPAVQYAGGTGSTNTNSSSAVAANWAQINQWLLQVNH